MNMTTSDLYNKQASDWKRSEPLLLSDYSARPFVLNLCGPIKDAKVLDIGCGEGYVSRQLMAKGAASVLGFDISEKMIDVAKSSEQFKGLSYAVSDIRSLSDFDGGNYDLILGMFLFNYLSIEEMHACMKECYRLLSPGGRFVFSIPHPFLAFLKPEGFPFYFKSSGNYFKSRDVLFSGEIWRRDRVPVGVQCIHKTVEDYFQGLRSSGFKNMPEVHELKINDDQFQIDPEFFEPLRGLPLHMAFKVIK